ncbi:diguanylate cyclase (GGDEF) domain-containing protein [Marinitoga hydrogenitolerans DSM 16785]|uniref:Diguanylate cyclase (GGDEF) domain-containing protein n=1 Tax=Marinitoga hydrogenitolerans (strain DSM 16785 / JCM 12826 / AT1271) TaxID=1122195 RepID=A0A1M4V9U7_MARH1|nr:GGDEF domain-containing protein [Marinitoga hydrogenitolerans]SHE65724.1 diguanylate cyclase (GGDEF) domain-containing protein [Marinitoga hydrogenitolerans DSM 16785]
MTLAVFNDITIKLEKDKKIKKLDEIEYVLKKLLVLTYDESFNLKGAMEIIYNYLRKMQLIDLFAYANLNDNKTAKVVLYYENKLYNYTKTHKDKSIIWYFVDNNLEKLYIPDISKFEINGYNILCKEIKNREITSYIFPYHFNRKIGGIFAFSKKGKDAFTEEEKKLIELIARQIDFIIRYQNILGKYQKEKEYFETIANKDILTNLYSRYFFNEWIIKHIEYLKRNNKKSIIVMIDINKFKKINDMYGHIKGDEVLKFVSSVILNNIRKMDIAIRFGGDEFLIIFPDSSFENIKIKMKELSQKIKKNNFDFDVTISYGIAELYIDNYIGALKIADEKMYKMKEKFK